MVGEIVSFDFSYNSIVIGIVCSMHYGILTLSSIGNIDMVSKLISCVAVIDVFHSETYEKYTN